MRYSLKIRHVLAGNLTMLAKHKKSTILAIKNFNTRKTLELKLAKSENHVLEIFERKKTQI